MLCVQEITDWEDTTQNHVYFLNDDRSKMLAYVRAGTDTVFEFSKPLGFTASRRKFLKIDNRWGFEPKEYVKPSKNKQWTVQGSTGKYIVEKTLNGLVCTCSGFKFRGNCRHVKEIEATL